MLSSTCSCGQATSKADQPILGFWKAGMENLITTSGTFPKPRRPGSTVPGHAVGGPTSAPERPSGIRH